MPKQKTKKAEPAQKTPAPPKGSVADALLGAPEKPLTGKDWFVQNVGAPEIWDSVPKHFRKDFINADKVLARSGPALEEKISAQQKKLDKLLAVKASVAAAAVTRAACIVAFKAEAATWLKYINDKVQVVK